MFVQVYGWGIVPKSIKFKPKFILKILRKKATIAWKDNQI